MILFNFFLILNFTPDSIVPKYTIGKKIMHEATVIKYSFMSLISFKYKILLRFSIYRKSYVLQKKLVRY